MFDGKFVATLAALAVAAFAIVNINSNTVTSSENFGMLPSQKVKVVQGQTDTNGKTTAVSTTQPRYTEATASLATVQPYSPSSTEGYSPPMGETYGHSTGEMFEVPGHYQAMLPPRNSGGVDFGSNIRYNPPAVEHMAVPREPLDYGLMAREDYEENYEENYPGGGCCGTSQSCGKGSVSDAVYGSPPLMKPNYSAGNFGPLTQQAMEQYPEATSNMLPVNDMKQLNTAGEAIQPVVFDRFIYANRNSRNRSQGDMIRGDLPIVPCQTGWFRPSVHPNLDLQQGAMNVMGGIENNTTQALSKFIAAVSGDSNIAGVDVMDGVNSVSTAINNSSEAVQALSSVQVSAF